MQYKHSDITGAIIEAFYDVYNTLGHGFLEKVYENALAHELRKRGHAVSQQAAISVQYDSIVAGEYYADLVVDGVVVVELKAAEGLAHEHEAQLVNYLKASCFEVGLLLNFGPRPEVRRRIYETARAAKSAATC
jgi:GxxExxY protein